MFETIFCILGVLAFASCCFILYEMNQAADFPNESGNQEDLD